VPGSSEGNRRNDEIEREMRSQHLNGVSAAIQKNEADVAAYQRQQQQSMNE
jgi:hypothetical protein